MKMLNIPEYHSLCTNDQTDETIAVKVVIDGVARMIPSRPMQHRVMAQLTHAFISGELDFMSFDERPKRLTSISMARDRKAPIVAIKARTITDHDAFPEDWAIADPQIFDAGPWNGQLK
jgi:hypothetical protein